MEYPLPETSETESVDCGAGPIETIFRAAMRGIMGQYDDRLQTLVTRDPDWSPQDNKLLHEGGCD